MNVLIINAIFNGGGAEKVARQLFYGLKTQEINTFMLVGKEFVFEHIPENVDAIYRYNKPAIKIINRARNLLSNNARKRDHFSRKKILSYIKKNNIDIVHFHNIHGNYIGIKDIGKISKKCSVVWTLHDMWSITGHCAYSIDCDRWVGNECVDCPNIDWLPKMFVNVAHNRYKEKKREFANRNIMYVVPSKWLLDQCNKTFLVNEQKKLIYNGVDTNAYFMLDKNEIRGKYNVSKDRVVLLFAANMLNSPYKGMKIIEKAMNLVRQKQRYELLVVGNGSPLSFSKEYICHYMGYIDNDMRMNELYNLADVFILPSRAENFPCAILESMSAGIPVIASAVGGVVEQIDEKTGWLFQNGNYRQLAQIIDALLEKSDSLYDMRIQCRKKVESCFTEEKMLEAYRKLYQEIRKEL